MSLPTNESKKSSTKQTVLMKMMKDSQAPKRPVNTFLAFSAAERAKVQEELGTGAGLEVTRELGRRWGLLGSEQKVVYESTFREAKIKYDEDMKTYQSSKEFLQQKAELEVKASTVYMKSGRSVEDYFAFLQTSWQKVHISSPSLSPKEIQDTIWVRWNTKIIMKAPPKTFKKSCNPLAPKKPLSAYFLFCNRERIKVTAETPKINNKEMLTELPRRWGLLEEAARAPFLARAKVLKAEYQVTLQEYTQAKTVGLAAADNTADAKTKEVEENNEDMIVGQDAGDETNDVKTRKVSENIEAVLATDDEKAVAKTREVEENSEARTQSLAADDEKAYVQIREVEDNNEARTAGLTTDGETAVAVENNIIEISDEEDTLESSDSDGHLIEISEVEDFMEQKYEKDINIPSNSGDFSFCTSSGEWDETVLEIKVQWRSSVVSVWARPQELMGSVMARLEARLHLPQGGLTLYRYSDCRQGISREARVSSLNLTLVSVLQTRTQLEREEGLQLRLQTRERRAAPILVSVQPTDKMGEVVKKYIQLTGLARDRVKFYLEGELLDVEQTADDLDLEGGECIDVHI